MAVTIPLYGRLADIYGRAGCSLPAPAIFLTGTTLCGFARSMELLIAVPRDAGARRRRDPADRHDDHRRRLHAGRAGPHPGHDVGGVRACRDRRPGAQRVSRRACALVGRVLGQSADRRRQPRDVRAVSARAGRAARAPHRLSRRRVADRRGRRADAGAGAGARPSAAAGSRRSSRSASARFPGCSCTSGARRSRCCRSGCGASRVLALCNLGGFGASATFMAVSALLPTYVQGVMGYSAGGQPGLSSARRRSAGRSPRSSPAG